MAVNYAGWDAFSSGWRIDAATERKYQRSWARRHAKQWVKDFAGRHVIYVDGNHDFVDIGEWLLYYGHPAECLHHICDKTPFVDVLGVRFAGFREIPRIVDEWVGETDDFKDIVDRTFECDPQVLVTHAPASGCLSDSPDYGIPALTSKLMYHPHRIVAHFFGHCHDDGGKNQEIGGIQFFNGACNMLVHEISV